MDGAQRGGPDGTDRSASAEPAAVLAPIRPGVAPGVRLRARPGLLELTGLGRRSLDLRDRRWRVPQDVAGVGLRLDGPSLPRQGDYLLLLNRFGETVAALPLEDWVPRSARPTPPVRGPAGDPAVLPVPWPLDACVAAAGLRPLAQQLNLAHVRPWRVRIASDRLAWWLIDAFVLVGLAFALTKPYFLLVRGVPSARPLAAVFTTAVAVAAAGFAGVVVVAGFRFGFRRTRSVGDDDAPGVLRPRPSRVISALFLKRCRVEMTEAGVALTDVGGKRLLLPADGVTAVTAWVMVCGTRRGLPRSLDLRAGSRTLVRLPWDAWFSGPQPDRAERCLRVHLSREYTDDAGPVLLPDLPGTAVPDAGLPWPVYLLLTTACGYQYVVWETVPGGWAQASRFAAVAAIAVMAVAYGLALAVQRRLTHQLVRTTRGQDDVPDWGTAPSHGRQEPSPDR